MPKTISGPLATHLAEEVTTLTTLWRITRIDKKAFFFTDHDVDVSFEGNLYEAALGYDRTAIANQVGLSVDNLDVSGFLDSSALTDGDLRAGLFDFAEVRISVVNFVDLSQGAIKMRRGKLGEVVYSDSGLFQAELRGLTQAYSQSIVELYEAECRVDLGDSKCKIDLLPDVVERNTTYAVGDAIRASEDLAGLVGTTLLVPADTDANDTTSNGALATLGVNAEVQTLVKKFGEGSIHFTPSATTDGTSFVSYPAIAPYDIGDQEFTIEAHMFLTTQLSGNRNMIMSQFDVSGNKRSWFFQVRQDNATIFWLGDRTGAASFFFAISDPVSGGISLNEWHHVAVTRDSGGTIRYFFNGDLVSSHAGLGDTLFATTADLKLGSFDDSGGEHRPLAGYIDNARLTVGQAIYTANFTPPAAPFTDPLSGAIDALETADFDDLTYVCTVAGVTAGIQPSYDAVVGNTTTDGTADFLAGEAFIRAGIVSNVNDNRVFSVTFPNGADAREVVDWFKYGAVIWDSGNNAFTVGLNMEVKSNIPPVTTGTLTMAVDDTDTFSRSSGSFIDDGFVVGMTINTTGFTDGANNGTFIVQAVADLTLDIEETTLVAEGGTGNEDITSDELISLFLPMPFVVEDGDTFGIAVGCDKRLATCIDKFDNVINFRGEPFVPGQDAFIAVQTPR